AVVVDANFRANFPPLATGAQPSGPSGALVAMSSTIRAPASAVSRAHCSGWMLFASGRGSTVVYRNVSRPQFARQLVHVADECHQHMVRSSLVHGPGGSFLKRGSFDWCETFWSQKLSVGTQNE